MMERHNRLLLQTHKLQGKMEAAKISAETLRHQIAATEKQLQELRDRLAELELEDKADSQPPQPHEDGHVQDSSDVPKWPLTQEEYTRYGRQMIVSSVGIKGRLCNSIT
jgi:adenylyltransferase and sulfurtransferase